MNISHRLARKIMNILVIGGMCIAAASGIVSTFFLIGKIGIYIGGCISFIGIGFAMIFLRCPYCKCLLKMDGFSPSYCPQYGRRI